MSTATIQATLGGAPDTIVFDGNIHRFKVGDGLTGLERLARRVAGEVRQ